MRTASLEDPRVDLGSYEPLAEGVEGNQTIDWRVRGGWTEKSPWPLDEDWVRRELGRMQAALLIDAEPDYRLPGRAARRDAFRLRQRLSRLAMDVLFGALPEECQALVAACVASEAWLPLTVPRLTGAMEPCGKVYSPWNIGPEYIRHFMGVLYDKDRFAEVLGQEFFPFENRDHLVHSFLVVVMGLVLLSAPIDEEARTAVARVLGSHPDSLGHCLTVGALAEHVYALSRMAPRGSSPAQWVRRAWPAVALWHDAGYDATTWNMLTWREFSHSFAVREALARINGVEVLERVRSFLGASLVPEVRESIERAASAGDGYSHFWCLEGCEVQHPNRRAWGRYHALFSAFEFMELLRCQESPDDETSEEERRRHLGAAIAHHHEQTQYAGRDGGLTDGELAELFVASPIGCILAFADLMSGFGRTKVVADNTGTGVPFKIKWKKDPLYIWLPGTLSRPVFCLGAKPSCGPMTVKLRALWGDFWEAESQAAKIPDCPSQGCMFLGNAG